MLELDSERTSSFITAFWGLFSLPFSLDISAVKGGLLYLEIDQKRKKNYTLVFYALCPNVCYSSSGVRRT